MEEELIESLKGRFDAILLNLFDKKLLERYNILSELPNANSRFQIAALFYTAEKKLYESIGSMHNILFHTLTDEEISVIYKKAISFSLNNSKTFTTNASITEIADILEQIDTATAQLLPLLIETFKKTRITKIFLSDIHIEIKFALVHKLASLSLFQKYDNEFYEEFENSLNEHLSDINDILNTQVAVDRSFDLKHSNIKANSDDQEIIKIYETIRDENSIAKEALYPWGASADAEYEDLRYLQPRYVRMELEYLFKNHITKDKSLFETATCNFVEDQFSPLNDHARKMAEPYINIEEKSKLCKDNILLLLKYHVELHVASSEFVQQQLNNFVAGLNCLFWPKCKEVAIILENSTYNYQCDFKKKVNYQLLKFFSWPQNESELPYKTRTFNKLKL